MKRYIRASESEVLYKDNDVIIKSYGSDKVIVYHYCDYDTPYYGKSKRDWLCCGIWRKYPDGLWYKWNEISGGKLSDGVDSYADIADMTRLD